MRPLSVLGAAALMVAFGLAVYVGLGSMRSVAAHPVVAPEQTRILVAVPGSIYLAQSGALFRLSGRKLTRLNTPAGEWIQPAPMLDGRLLAVNRHGNFSDLYVLGADGSAQQQLTDNRAAAVEGNHWAFFPALSLDGATIFYSFDDKDASNSFRVDLSIWSRPLAGGRPSRFTDETPYTGGDIQPRPAAAGLIFTRFGVSPESASQSEIRSSTGAGNDGLRLTDPNLSCAQPALSPDGRRLAMICSGGRQVTSLVVGDFDGKGLSNQRTLVDNQLVAGPVWSPDGQSLIYLGLGGTTPGFQLWWLTPGSQPIQVSRDLSLDATSAPVWVGE